MSKAKRKRTRTKKGHFFKDPTFVIMEQWTWQKICRKKGCLLWPFFRWDIIHSISTSYFLLLSLFPEHQGWKRPLTLNTRRQNTNYLTQRCFMKLLLSFYLFLFCLLSVIVLSQNVSPPLLSFFWKSSHIWDSFHHSKYY